jgi:hypothetical protein
MTSDPCSRRFPLASRHGDLSLKSCEQNSSEHGGPESVSEPPLLALRTGSTTIRSVIVQEPEVAAAGAQIAVVVTETAEL